MTLYQNLVTTSWPRFMAFAVGGYGIAVVFFGSLFYAMGPGAIVGARASGGGRMLDSFFFTAHTVTTVGYGHFFPQSSQANFLAMIAAFCGLSGVAVVAALMFARMARPTALLRFSKDAIVRMDAICRPCSFES